MGGSMQDAQRKAWNEAMRSAAGQSLRPSAGARRSDRQKRKQARRNKARKSTAAAAFSGGGDESFTLEGREYRAAVRIDALEEVVDDGLQAVMDDDEEEYDELEEVLFSESTGPKRKRRGGTASSGSTSKKLGALPKRLRPRTLASILIEESCREDGITKKYLNAEATLPSTTNQSSTSTCTYPTRKFCPVTGLLGVYTDPKSGIPYANIKALEQIRERAPPWMNLGGSATYWEAVKSLRDED